VARLTLKSPKAPTSAWGMWTLVGTWLLAVGAGLWGGGFGPLLDSLAAFFTGNLEQLHRLTASPLQLVTLTAAYVAIDIPLAIIVAKLAHLRLEEADNSIGGLFGGWGEKRYFQVIFLTVLVEELFARWLFLGVIGHFWTGPAALYTLVFLGNAIWALIHLFNYKNTKQRNPLRVLSQFVGGLVLSVIFVKYGFMAVLLAHFAFDAVVFGVNKRQVWGRASGLTTSYNAVVALVSFGLMQFVTDTHLSALGSWLSDNPTLAIPGWNLADYVLAAAFIGAVIGVVMELLAYDQDNLTKSDDDEHGLMAYLIGAVIIVGLCLGGYWALGLVMTNTPHRLMVVALVIMLASTGMSGSAMARSFWQGLPLLYVTLACMLGLGFWGAVAFILIRVAIGLPERAINRNTTEFIRLSHRSAVPA
jgi:hypothetical protein